MQTVLSDISRKPGPQRGKRVAMRSLVRLAMAAVLAIAVLALAVGLMLPASAQTPDTATLTAPQVDALVSRLSDKEVRELLLQELDSRAAPAPAIAPRPQPLVDVITGPLRTIMGRVAAVVATTPENLSAILSATGKYGELIGRNGVIRLGLVLLAAILAGLAVDRLISSWLIAKEAKRPPPVANAPAFPGSLPLLLRRLINDAAGAVLSLIVAAVLLAMLLPEREVRIGMSIALWLVFFPRLVHTVLRFFLSPDLPDMRLVDTDDITAKRLTRSLVGVFFVVGLIGTLLLILEEVGMAKDSLAVGFWANLLVFVWLGVTVIRCRSGLKQIVAGGQEPLRPGEKWVADVYPAYALIVIALTWVSGVVSASLGNESFVREGRHLVSLGVLLVAPMFDALIRAVVRLVVPPMQGSGAAARKAFEASWRSHVRVGRVIVFGAVTIVLAKLWGLSLVGLAQAGVGERMGERLVAAILIVAIGYMLLELVNLAVNRKLANLRPETVVVVDPRTEESIHVASDAASRLATILPPISWMVQGVIIVVTTLMALGHLGVNVTALLAGAGVAGIAIGFGAQKLVADLVSGVFFLMDDAFRLNEYISTGKIEGYVEKFGLQSMHMRQTDGALHCVPYSGVATITNFSRNWGTTKLTFTVPFDTDIERIRKIFDQIGADVAANPDYRNAILQPFSFKGLSEVSENGVVVSGKFMFKPEYRKQFAIRREINNRVHAEFAKAGIHFARREVNLNVETEGKPLTEAEATILDVTQAATPGTTGTKD